MLHGSGVQSAAGHAGLGDTVGSDDEEVLLAREEDFLPCVASKVITSAGKDATGEFGEYKLGNAPRLMSSCKNYIISICRYYLSAGPLPVNNLAEGGKCFVLLVPIFVAFLDADNGGVEFAVQLEG